MPLKGAVIAVAALILAGCSIFEPPGPPANTLEPGPEADYAKLVASNGTVKTLRAKASYAPFEISGLRRAVAPQLGEWATCLRTSEAGRPVYFGVLMKGRIVSDVRLAVAIDRCEHDQFLPLPSPG